MVGKLSCSQVVNVLCVGLQELGRHHKNVLLHLNPDKSSYGLYP